MSQKTENIVIEGILSPTVFAPPSALEKRDGLLAAAKVVKLVTDADSAEQAIDVLKQLKEFSRAIEVSRKEVKAPVDAVVFSIQTIAKTLTQQIDLESGRIDRMVGDYNAVLEKIAEKKRQEALEEEQRIIDAANKKLADAAASGASESKLQKIEDKAFNQLATAKAETAAISAPAFSGVSGRTVWEYEVTSFEELYKAYPTAVQFSAVDAVIKALLKQGKALPGVTARQVNRTVVR